MALLSDTDVGLAQPAAPSKPQLLPDEAVGLGEAGERRMKATTVTGEVVQRLKGVGGEAAAIADLVLGMPNFLARTGVQLGAAAQSAVRGSKDPFAEGRLAGQGYDIMMSEIPVLRTADSPLRHLMESFNSGEAYDQALTSQGMAKLTEKIEAAGKWVEEATGGRVSRDALPMFAETLMAGATGLGSGVTARGRAAIRARTPEQGGIADWQRKALRDSAEKLRRESEAEIAQRGFDAKQAAETRAAVAPVQTQINDLLGIRTPQEQAKVTRQRRKDIQQAFREPAEGSDYPTGIDESIFKAEERIANEEAYRKGQAEPPAETPRPVGQAEVMEALQTPGPERTAEQLDTLRSAAEARRAFEAREQEIAGSQADRLIYRSRERGDASPEALLLMGAAGVGALAGAELDDNALRGMTLGGLTGAAAAAPFMFRGESLGKVGRGQRGAAGLDTRSVTESLMFEFGGPDRSKWTERTKTNAADYAVSKARYATDPLMKAKYEQAAKVLRGEIQEPGLIGGSPYAGPGRGQLGAVKAPGGMWHPEAVERLAEPLIGKLGVDAAGTIGRLPSTSEWGRKAIRNYLNKYAGTERDPLKDVEIPFGNDVKRWGELTDKTVRGVENYPQFSAEQIGAKPGETVFDLGGVSPEKRAIESYLSHVGDYLRQNVDPAKLQQYDLVRAVQETYKNDLRVAKEMEKAAAASTKDLPVYKEYPDGMRWVELKEPEKLTPEQAKGVRPSTKEEGRGIEREEYTAIDASGKPIRNSYTGDIAKGKTPTRAYLAGRLAEEGNQMGHCVGGYCEGVAAGESKIYSLRDKKGQSHVTVEVTPPDVRAPHNSPEHFARVKGGELLERYNKASSSREVADLVALNREIVRTPEFQEWLSRNPADISQIKGKQNRAPKAEYLPYVQDFVKSGKWGEVGDLENTGLRKFEDQYLTPEELAKSDPRTAELWRQRIARDERGQIDPKLAIGLGAVGLGGLIGSQWADDPVHGAVLGALAGGALAFPGAKSLKAAAQGIDYAAGMLSTRILNRIPELHQALISHAQQELEQTHRALDRAVPWLKEYRRISEETRERLNQGIFLKNPELIADANRGNRELVAGWRETRNMLADLGKKAQGLGRFKELIDDYFPQRVKDFKGLREFLGREVQSKLDAELSAAEAKARKRGAELTDAERDAIVNRLIRNEFKTLSHRPNYAKDRRIQQVTKDLQQFYYSPPEALAMTVSEITKDLETAKLFGRDLVTREQGGRSFTDVGASIGNVLGRELKSGRLTPDEFNELQSMLISRFGPGERSPSRWVQNAQNMSYAALLGDIPSAITQLGDPAMSIPAHGLRSTLVAVGRLLSGGAKVGSKELHLMDHIAEDLAFGASQLGGSAAKTRAAVGVGAAVGATAGAMLQDDLQGAIPGAAAGAFLGYTRAVGTSAALNKVLKQGVFTMIDKFGKDVQLGAAHEKLTRWAQTNNLKAFENSSLKYPEAFGEEFPLLVADLKAGRLTPRVRSALFAELSRTQPVSKLESSQFLLDNPNGRILGTLKRFMMKQADFIRREAYNEIRKGAGKSGEEKLTHVGKGLGKLAEFAAVLGLSGASASMLQNWVLGRQVDFTANDVAENVLKTFGLSNYVLDKMREGGKGPIEAIGGSMLPPYAIMDRILTADPKAVQYIPVVGQLYYNWELGGREEAELRDARKAKKEGREVELSSRAEDYRDQKRDKQKAKRERENR